MEISFAQVSYAIGVAKPLSVFISSYGTGVKSDAELLRIVNENFDLRPGRIVKLVFTQSFTKERNVTSDFICSTFFLLLFYRDLDLKRPIYSKTASYGHFGRPEFAWEKPKHLKF